MSTLVCVPIMVQDTASALADASAARDAGADIVEFRIDELFSGALDSDGNVDQHELETILSLVKLSPLPSIVTCRSASEGGSYDGDDMARVALYQRLGNADTAPSYLDFEQATYSRSANLKHKINLAVNHTPGLDSDRPAAHARAVTSRLILSMHDFQGRPNDLLRRLAAIYNEPAARVVKCAFTARSLRDNLEVFDLLMDRPDSRPTIALAMGQFGLMSRVLAPKFGGFLTFASIRKQSTTAPGQPTVHDLLQLFRFRTINPRTRVFGVVGWPIDHSLSPHIHNAGFESLRPESWDSADVNQSAAHNSVYLPLPVPPEYEHFKATLSALIDHPHLDFSGCSVTLPHKQHLVRFAYERIAAGDSTQWSIDELSRAAGAANTLVIHRDAQGLAARARVLNTDAAAAAGVLAEALASTRGSLAGARIGLIGSGGVARAIAAGLLTAGSRVLVSNRTSDNALALAADLNSALPATANITAINAHELIASDLDAIINCTPIGMSSGPAPKDCPVSVEALARGSPRAIVFDTIYNPLITPLLRDAHIAGLRTIDGLEMFVRQAAQQFHAFTGAQAPMGLFRQVALESLNSPA